MIVDRSDFLFFSFNRHVTDNWMQVADAGKLRRKKGMFGRQSVDKEVIFNQEFNYLSLLTLKQLDYF